ncbi:metal ABC transporter permease [Vibrio salinus]|uniref:metal ABC transporter permease n=1 Tax=Vibrio salinus TaxID=2899784 RepID=UPI001E3D66BE|nr:metal ABC transporter permease [Vibrio salinus]MCE0495012.1 metal ABC transporter permease [Vibrio salinus]
MDSLYQWLLEPYQYEFMQRALIAGLCVSLVCAVLSCYLVLKGWSLMGDAISHAVLPGIVIAYVLQIALPVGAFLSGLLCALQTGYIKNNSRLKEDTVLGVVYSGMLALGLVMFTKIETDQHLLHILFGNMLGINNSEYYQTIVISLLVFLIIVLFHKQLMLYCFDASHARVIGLPVRLIHYGFMIMISLTVVAAIQAVGVIMVVALLISPGITALLIVKRFTSMLLVACAVSVSSILLGTLISFHIDGATGACIVLVQAGLFVITLSLSHLRRIQRRHRKAIRSVKPA